MDARMKLTGLTVLAVLAVAALAGACGGSGSDGGAVGVSDPAEVPTSTPIVNPLTFRTKNDELQIDPGGNGTPGTGAADPQTHIIGEGETCADIASQYGITVDDLKRANSGINSDCTNLIAGEELRIPNASPTAGPTGASGTPTPSSGGQEYVIQEGDTCSDIAASFGVAVEDIIAVNGLDPSCTGLFPGDVIIIP
jgi:LysM repeat protein